MIRRSRRPRRCDRSNFERTRSGPHGRHGSPRTIHTTRRTRGRRHTLGQHSWRRADRSAPTRRSARRDSTARRYRYRRRCRTPDRARRSVSRMHAWTDSLRLPQARGGPRGRRGHRGRRRLERSRRRPRAQRRRRGRSLPPTTPRLRRSRLRAHTRWRGMQRAPRDGTSTAPGSRRRGTHPGSPYRCLLLAPAISTSWPASYQTAPCRPMHRRSYRVPH